MSFAATFKRHRISVGLSLQAVADQIGVSKQAVHKWESGRAVPEFAHREPVATIMGITVDELVTMFGDDDNAEDYRERITALDRRIVDLTDNVSIMQDEMQTLRQEFARLIEVVELALDGGDDELAPDDPRVDPPTA